MPYLKDREIDEYIQKKIGEMTAATPEYEHKLRFIPAAQANTWFWYYDLRNYKMNLGAFVPDDIGNFVGPNTLLTDFSCERIEAYEIFYKEYYDSSTQYSGFMYMGTGNIQDHHQLAFPPILPIHIDTNLSYAYLAGWLHIVTKHGLTINGISYPSTHVEVRSGD